MFLTKKISKKTGVRATLLFLPFVFTASAVLADPWVGPTQAPPLGNVAAPINDSGTGQLKAGGLSLGSLIVNGGSVLNGSVGIGTASLGRSLHVVGGMQIGESQNTTYNATVPNWGLLLKSSGTQSRTSGLYQGDTADADGGLQLSSTHYGINFKAGNTPTSKMYIETSGNVGIGTTTPATTLDVNGNARVGVLQFKGVSGDSGSAVTGYGIYQEPGAWVNPYPDLVIGYHTGIKIGAVPGYGGTRFYNNAPGLAGATEIFSVGDGDNNVRVANDLHFGGDLYSNGVLAGDGIGNFGQLDIHGSYSDFNASINKWGWNYVAGTANAPNTDSSQWYRFSGSLGSNYTANQYRLELAYPRLNQVAAGIWMRTMEGGVFQPWVNVSGASSLDGLSDASNSDTSLYIGTNTGNIGTESANRNNIGVGHYNFRDITTGYHNTSVGYNNSTSLTTGYQNTAVGFYANRLRTVGYHTTAIGSYSQEQNTGNLNTSVGSHSIRFGSGNGNTAVGYASLDALTTGASNVAVGAQALTVNTTGYYNVGVGRYALDLNTTGTGSTALGHHALSNNNASYNTAVGYQAAYLNTTGIHNTAVGGYRSLYSNTTGAYNVGMGTYSLYAGTTSSGNTGVGAHALIRNTTGTYNTALGYDAGRYWGGLADSNLAGDYNVYIGYRARPLLSGQSNQIVIGKDAIGGGSNTVTLGGTSITDTFLNGVLRRNTSDSGYFVGTHNQASVSTTPAHTEPIYTLGTSYKPSLTALGNMYGIGWTYANNASFITLAGATGWGQYVAADGDARIFLSGSTGNIYASGFVYGSDERLKKNIAPIENSLDKIMQLEGVNFNWKESGKYSLGLIAQNVEKVFPEIVATSENGEGLKAVEYGNLVAPLIEAVKEQQEQIRDQQKRMEWLEEKVRELSDK